MKRLQESLIIESSIVNYCVSNKLDVNALINQRWIVAGKKMKVARGNVIYLTFTGKIISIELIRVEFHQNASFRY